METTNDSNSNNIGQETAKQPVETTESIKNKLIDVLLDKGLILNGHIGKINNLVDIENYIKNLYTDKSINREKYLQILFEGGRIKLGQILIAEGIISELQLEMALKIQKAHHTDKSLGEIIRNIILNNKTEIKNQEKINKFFKILENLGVMKIGEYLISQNIISEEELNEYLKYQKEKNISLGKILIEKNKLTQEQLNEILEKLGIRINISDLKINHELDYYELKPNSGILTKEKLSCPWEKTQQKK